MISNWQSWHKLEAAGQTAGIQGSYWSCTFSKCKLLSSEDTPRPKHTSVLCHLFTFTVVPIPSLRSNPLTAEQACSNLGPAEQRSGPEQPYLVWWDSSKGLDDGCQGDARLLGHVRGDGEAVAGTAHVTGAGVPCKTQQGTVKGCHSGIHSETLGCLSRIWEENMDDIPVDMSTQYIKEGGSLIPTVKSALMS